mgnify:CR=1 FL=1
MATFKRDLKSLQEQSFDVLIIGGGITGAWLALHCQQAGLKTALVERSDYASETSSASSKLLHGGIRYLQQMQFAKVRESAMERAEFVYAAPHLSKPVPFIVPTYPDFQRSKFFLNCGMLAYAALSLGQNRVIGSKAETLPPTRNLTRNELNKIYRIDDNHTGGVVFYERHMFDSERMVLDILKSAADAGAVINNYVNVEHLTVEHLTFDQQRVVGATAVDTLDDVSFTISANLVINAAGPWIDDLNGKLPKAALAPSINGFAVGSHIITRQISDHAIAIATQLESDTTIDRGGRHVFIIPWRGYSLIGTSYDEIDSSHHKVSIQADHVNQLLDAVNQGIPNACLTRADLISGYSGLYPLRTDNIKATVYQGSGEYQVIDHAKANGVEGLITALGAKFTTGRKLSALTMRQVARKLQRTLSVTRSRLSASNYQEFDTLLNDLLSQYQSRYSEATIRHLAQSYGSQASAVLDSASTDVLKEHIMPSQPDIMAQVTWAIEHEQAMTLEDVLFRRLSLGLLGINDAQIKAVAGVMASALQWSSEAAQQQIEQVQAQLALIHDALHPSTS